MSGSSRKLAARTWNLGGLSEAGSGERGAGSRKPEAGSRKLEAGSWKLEAGSWKLEAGFMRITDFEIIDLRFPTSQTNAGTDAMHPDPDYSAAYVVLKTDAD